MLLLIEIQHKRTTLLVFLMAFLPSELGTLSSHFNSAPSSFYSSFWCRKACSPLLWNMCLFLVFPPLQGFSFHFYLNINFFSALCNQYMYFQVFIFSSQLLPVRPTHKNQDIIHIMLQWWPLAPLTYKMNLMYVRYQITPIKTNEQTPRRQWYWYNQAMTWV